MFRFTGNTSIVTGFGETILSNIAEIKRIHVEKLISVCILKKIEH